MSIYGTYLGFSLPLSKLAALVANRPSVWPLASTTYHLRSISLPLGTKVDISLLPSNARPPQSLPAVSTNPMRKALTPTQNARASNPPTTKQSCSGEDCEGWPDQGTMAGLD